MSNASDYERVCEIVEVGLPVFQGTVQRPVQVSKKVKGGGFLGLKAGFMLTVFWVI